MYFSIDVNVDDRDMLEMQYTGKKSVPTTSALYLGGVPATYNINPDNAASTDTFVGCLGDVTINAK